LAKKTVLIGCSVGVSENAGTIANGHDDEYSLNDDEYSPNIAVRHQGMMDEIR
jgi:hypothetical protein